MCCYRSKRFVAGLPPLPAAPENPIGKPPGKPIVCYVTDRRALGTCDPGEGVTARIRAAVAAGVDWVQVREKDLAGQELLALVVLAMAFAAREARGGNARARTIVNDRLDVALSAGADGVHLGGESLPARDAIRWCRGGNAPAEFLIGVSCHSIEEAREAENAGASYAFFGPIFETPSKERFGAPQGIARLAEVCRAVRIPVIAIGGVSEENGPECVRAGAAGIAAIRLFQETGDAVALRKAIARLHARM
jgi:thiamine-phosphate pyrophosphorylase